jgi:cytoskeletal protein RodZ
MNQRLTLWLALLIAVAAGALWYLNHLANQPVQPANIPMPSATREAADTTETTATTPAATPAPSAPATAESGSSATASADAELESILADFDADADAEYDDSSVNDDFSGNPDEAL